MFFGVGLLVMTDQRASWQGWLPALWARSTTMTILGAPLTAMVAAYLFSGPRQLGLVSWLRASGASLRRTLVPLLALAWVPAVCAYVLVVLTLIGQGALAEGWGGLTPQAALVSVSVAAYLALAAVVGGGLGWLLPRWLAVGLAGIVCYLVYGAPIYALPWSDSPLTQAVLASAHVAGTYDWSIQVAAPTVLLLTAALYTSLAVALWSALTGGRRGLAAWLGAALSLSALTWTAGSASAIPHSQDATCIDGHPQVCMSTSFKAVLPGFAQLVQSEMPSFPPGMRPHQVWSDDLMSLQEPPPGVFVFSPSDGKTMPSRTLNSADTTARLLPALIDVRCGPTATATDERAWAEVYAYWTLRHGLDLDGGNYIGEGGVALLPDASIAIADATAVLSHPDADQGTWLAERLRALGCPTG
ncbi:hypothetical protein BJY21_002977 [Kineosphaera limosa]|uniref:hypothetical protein n=1 Tax=Kineosphaera limosa TaxID=111564 RepID=UPI0002D6B503|nr:hypothetical protein [Kineosphaera limosa]NYE01793.1 hypothetical protein [Kineosphaera limosa]